MSDLEFEISEIRRLLSYNPVSGLFRWNFTRSRTLAGTIAGTKKKGGWINISVNKKTHQAHRLAFVMMTGAFPAFEVDHKDCNPANNKWNNLRPATSAQNNWNSRIRKDNSTGVKGVSFIKRFNKYRATLKANGKLVFSRYCDTITEAASAVSKARSLHHGEYARH